MKVLPKTTTLAAVLLAGILSGMNHAAAEPPGTASPAKTTWTSSSGTFKVSYTPSLDPIAINRIHHWVLDLRDSDMQPIAGADIEVKGGMPTHNHGLPTRPHLTRELQTGRYRVEGFRFHMPGTWEIQLLIEVKGVRDTVIIPLQL